LFVYLNVYTQLVVFYNKGKYSKTTLFFQSKRLCTYTKHWRNRKLGKFLSLITFFCHWFQYCIYWTKCDHVQFHEPWLSNIWCRRWQFKQHVG